MSRSAAKSLANCTRRVRLPGPVAVEGADAGRVSLALSPVAGGAGEALSPLDLKWLTITAKASLSGAPLGLERLGQRLAGVG